MIQKDDVRDISIKGVRDDTGRCRVDVLRAAVVYNVMDYDSAEYNKDGMDYVGNDRDGKKVGVDVCIHTGCVTPGSYATFSVAVPYTSYNRDIEHHNAIIACIGDGAARDDVVTVLGWVTVKLLNKYRSATMGGRTRCASAPVHILKPIRLLENMLKYDKLCV